MNVSRKVTRKSIAEALNAHIRRDPPRLRMTPGIRRACLERTRGPL